MKLHLLEKLIEEFLTFQLTSIEELWYLTHSIVDHFHRTWNNSNDISLKAKYDESLKSDISLRWWKREHYRPKEIMFQLIDADNELASIAFKELARDSASLDGRLSRFQYYCDELLQMHRRNDPRSVISYHHQDTSIISLYLAGMFPEKYTLYPGLDVFKKYCQAVGSPDIPLVDDLVRYMKVSSIIYTFIRRNIKFELLTEHRTKEIHKINYLPFQCVYEFISYAGGNPRLEI